MSIVCASICLCTNTQRKRTATFDKRSSLGGGGQRHTCASAYRGKGVGHLPEYDLEEFGHVVGIEQRNIAHQLPLVLVRHTRRSPPVQPQRQHDTCGA